MQHLVMVAGIPALSRDRFLRSRNASILANGSGSIRT